MSVFRKYFGDGSSKFADREPAQFRNLGISNEEAWGLGSIRRGFLQGHRSALLMARGSAGGGLPPVQHNYYQDFGERHAMIIARWQDGQRGWLRPPMRFFRSSGNGRMIFRRDLLALAQHRQERLEHRAELAGRLEQLLERQVRVALQQVVVAELAVLKRKAGNLVGEFPPQDVG